MSLDKLLMNQAQLDARDERHRHCCPPQFIVERRKKAFITKGRPEPWAVFRVCEHGSALRWRGTKAQCLAMKEQYEMIAALQAMTKDTPAEGLKL